MQESKNIESSLAFYIHIPFCQTICPYCGFYKVKDQPQLEVDLIDALLVEMQYYANHFQLPAVHSIFLGGGTPSILSQGALSRLFKMIYDTFIVTPSCEITMELNPENVSDALLTQYQALGINRLSLGVQSFNDQDLQFLGRGHSVATNIDAVTTITQHDNWNYNIDLITGLPELTLDQLSYSLDQTLLFNPTHISTYTLSIEPQTMFEKRQVVPLEQSIEATHYRYISDKLQRKEYIHYEVSAFSKLGYESRHNCTYWRYLPFIGFGPSANSFFDQRRYTNSASITEYIKNPLPQLSDPLTVDIQIQEFLISNLRLKEGFPLSTFCQRFGVDFQVYFSKQLAQLTDLGLVVVDKGSCKTTMKGRFLLNEVLLVLI